MKPLLRIFAGLSSRGLQHQTTRNLSSLQLLLVYVRMPRNALCSCGIPEIRDALAQLYKHPLAAERASLLPQRASLRGGVSRVGHTRCALYALHIHSHLRTIRAPTPAAEHPELSCVRCRNVVGTSCGILERARARQPQPRSEPEVRRRAHRTVRRNVLRTRASLMHLLRRVGAHPKSKDVRSSISVRRPKFSVDVVDVRAQAAAVNVFDW